MKKDFLLKTSKNEKLRITAFGVEHLNTSPCLILVHGFKGFKDWGYAPFAGEYFANKNYFVITFNFSHNGIGDNLTEFTELEKFAKNTFSLEIEELNELIDAYLNGFFGVKGKHPIGLIGHSRGGAISLLTAKNNAVNAVSVWASVAELDRYSEKQKEKWRKTGLFEVMNQRTKQVMSLNISLLEDIEKNGNSTLNLKKAVQELNKPLYIAHGKQDLAVPIKEALSLYEWSDKNNSTLLILESAGHTFGIEHPFKGTNKTFNTLIETTEQFFRNHLF